MADIRINDHLPMDAGGWKFILVPVHPTLGTPIPRWQVGEVAVEMVENVFVPYVMEKPAAGGGQGRKGVAVPHTPETLVGVATPARAVTVMALRTNTDVVAVGLSNTVRSGPAGSEAGMLLLPGQSFVLGVRDVMSVWIDAQVAGEGVSYLYVV